MKFPKLLTIGLLSLSAIVLNALPSLARPALIDYEANLRSGPSMEADRIDGLPKGMPLEVLRIMPGIGQKIERWYYVRSTGDLHTEGWVTSSLVRFEASNQNYGTLAGSEGDVINIRSAPNLQSRVVHTGVLGDLVKVGESKFVPLGKDYGRTGYRWYNVTYPNSASGWVRGDLINVWPQGCIITCPEY
jgi:Bacterial SH3 domain